MHPYVATLGISLLLVLGGTAISTMAAPEPSPEQDAHEAHDAPRSGHGHGGGAHPWEGGTGRIPTSTQAMTELERRVRIQIDEDSEFNPANGVRSGSGTFDDPFVISGWYVDSIYIHDTTLAFEIKENYVSDILVLDWTGQGGYVHHNHLDNLRTNRNVERTGDPTAAVFEHNTILRVEELRHFDGVVRNNTIGRGDLLGSLLQPEVVLNIAGLNGAGIHHNRIFGGVDMKIHGHHHSDTPGAHSHNHGEADEQQAEDHVEDHQVRYVDFLFYENVIQDVGFGLRYNDLNHAGDDRQATSEQEPDLELPHVHHTTIRLVGNTIDGATLRVAVLNADDERHVTGETAYMEIADNRILKPAAGDGLVVADVKDARVHLHGNKVEKGDLQLSGASAILLTRFRNATVEVGENKLGAYKYGVRASEFDANTTWSVGQNDAPGVDQPVYWDDSVANPPQGAEGGDAHAHDHGHAREAAAPSLLRRLGLAR